MAASLIMSSLFALHLAGGAVFARRNLRLGRGDRRGAFRLGAFMMTAMMVGWVVEEQHVAGFAEIFLFMSHAGYALFLAVMSWMLYLAVEPYVRRNVPGILVSWSRLVAGGLRDPLVGRELLIGCAAGAVVAALQSIRVLLPAWIGRPAEQLAQVSELTGVAGFIGALAGAAAWGVFLGMSVLFSFFVARLLLKRDALAIAAVVFVLTLIPSSRGTNLLLVVLLSLVINAIPVITLARAGLLAVLTLAFSLTAITAAPAIVPLGSWHMPLGVGLLVVVGALALYAFACALGGRAAFGSLAIEA
jgi:serine/threonine-protein kinase